MFTHNFGDSATPPSVYTSHFSKLTRVVHQYNTKFTCFCTSASLNAILSQIHTWLFNFTSAFSLTFQPSDPTTNQQRHV